MPDSQSPILPFTGEPQPPARIAGPDAPVGEITALGLLNRVLRNRKLIMASAAIGFLLMAITSLVTPRTWTSSGSFVPSSRQAKSGLAALAAQYGVQMSADEPSQNPDFYADLMRSRGILTLLAQSKLQERTSKGVSTVTIGERLDITEGAPEMRAESALLTLRGMINATVTSKTGLMTFTVTSRDAKLSEQIATRLLELLNKFNVESRQQQAASERRFTEQRLAEVKVDLRAAEDRMVDFQLRNRSQGLADLQYSSERLLREIQRLQSLYTTLEQAYEQARIDEVRDTPLLTLIDKPVVPLLPDPRGTVTKSLLGIVLGSLLGLMIAVVREQFSGVNAAEAHRNPEYREFAMLKTQTLDELRGFGHIFGRVNERRSATSKTPPQSRSDAGAPH